MEKIRFVRMSKYDEIRIEEFSDNEELEYEIKRNGFKGIIKRNIRDIRIGYNILHLQGNYD